MFWDPTVEVAPPRTRLQPGAAEVSGAIACVERVAALGTLAALLPGLGAAALIVAVLSGRSPFIAHARVGLDGRRLWMLKLRTMWPSTPPGRSARAWLVERIEAAPVPERKLAADARVTSRFAAFCRRHSIDELPQLWHVAAGEMSLVGPRPMTAAELARWYGADAPEVLSRKPGLTGLWQVMGRNSLTYPQRRRLDLFLVRRWSPAFYLRILLSTVPRVLSGENAT